MAHLQRFERLALRSFESFRSANVCQSCQLRLASRYQRRQLHSSANSLAGSSGSGILSRFRRTSDPESAAPAEEATGTEDVMETEEQTDNIDPSSDPSYVEAATWDGLEHVGSAQWLEKQEDPQDRFEGYASH